jgi:hypothetical protein
MIYIVLENYSAVHGTRLTRQKRGEGMDNTAVLVLLYFILQKIRSK